MIKSHPQDIVDAVYSGDLKTIERYVNKDNVNWIDENGDSLLTLAATAGDVNMKIVRLLVKRGADVNITIGEGWTLLHLAAHLLNKDLASVLLRGGCDPNAFDSAGQTALAKVLFAFNLKAALVEMLLEYGADTNLRYRGGDSALELAAKTGQSSLFPTK